MRAWRERICFDTGYYVSHKYYYIMMKHAGGFIFMVAFAASLCGSVAPTAHAQSDAVQNVASLMETLKSLLAKVADLQSELAKIRGDVQDTQKEIRETLKDGLKEGMTDDDIREIQEILATDSDIYPEGLATGYFGKLTKDALKRFQNKHGIDATGQIDKETKELLEEYLNERFDGKVPQGLLRAPGIIKKVQDRICEHSRIVAWGLFCNGHDRNHADDDAAESEDYDIAVEVKNGKTTVSFTFDRDDIEVTIGSTDLDEILEAIAEELDEDLDDVDSAFVRALEVKLKKELKDEDAEALEAEEAISEAKEAIEDAEDVLDEAAADADTDDAEEKLAKARESLEDAEDAFDDEDFEEAREHADDAKDLAREAEELAEDAE